MPVQTLPRDGQTYVGDNPQVMKVARCTLAFAGGDVNTGAVQGTYPLFSVPAGFMVLEVMTVTTVAWTASVTIGIGDVDSTSGWLATAVLAPQAAVATGLLKSTDVATAAAYAGGRIYNTAYLISALVAGANPGVGTTEVFIRYIESAFVAL